MSNLFVYDVVRTYLEELAREAEEERSAHHARSVNEGAVTADDGAQHAPASDEPSGDGRQEDERS